MAERVRTYSPAVGRFHFGLAGLWVLLGLLATVVGDRLFAGFCLVSVLGSGLNGANQTWWRGTNRWFRPAMSCVLVALAVVAVLYVVDLVHDIRVQY